MIDSGSKPVTAPQRPRHYQFWPKRIPHRITPPATSLWHNLAISELRYPDKTVMVFFGRKTRYTELKEQAERLAGFLQHIGVTAGDRVLLDMQNCPQLVIAHWAILRANAVVVPVNPMNRAEELKHYITDPDAHVAITTADLAPELASASNQLLAHERLTHIISTHFSDAFDARVEGDDAPPPAWMPWLTARHAAPRLDGGQVTDWVDALAQARVPSEHRARPEDLAVLPYTSGTTGLPKGCMHPHATIMHQVAASALLGGGSAENISLAVVPMFHATGMIGLMHGAIYAGAEMVIMPRWDRDLAGRLISRWRVTHWGNIPTMVIDLLASPHFGSYDLSSLVYIGGGGAAVRRCLKPWRNGFLNTMVFVTPKGTGLPRPRHPRISTRRSTPSSSAWEFPTWAPKRALSTRIRCKRCRSANKARSSCVARRTSRLTGNGRMPRRRRLWRSMESASSVRGTSGAWTRRGTTS